MIRPLEAFPLQTFLPQTKTGALPVQDFDLVAFTIDENKQLAGKRIAGQLFFDQDRQTIDTLAEVDRLAA